MTRTLPLRTGYFKTPQLSALEEKELIEWVYSLLPSLQLEEAQWEYVHEKRGVQISEDRQKGGTFYSSRGINTVAGTLDDVMEVLSTTNTLEFRSLMRSLHRDHFLDSAVIYYKKISETEHLSIKWFALRSHSATALDQDFCVLEYSGLISADRLGLDSRKTVGVLLYESIEQAECPLMLATHKLERGSISRCGYVFIPTEENSLIEGQFVCSIRQPHGVRSRRRSNRALLVQWAETLGRIQETSNTRRISNLVTLRSNAPWVADDDRQCCHLCLKTFTNIRRKHHCRVCGEIICNKCSVHNNVDLPSIGFTTLRICKSCADGDWKEKGQTESRSKEDALISRNDYSLALPEDIYDLLCDLASQALDCKFAIVSLLDEKRQWFKSTIKISESDIPRDFSFCEYPVRLQKPIVVMDTLLDKRFESNPFVTGNLGIRFFAGAPLFTMDGKCVGSVCVLDTEPRTTLPQTQLALMEKLAYLAMLSMQERREAVIKQQMKVYSQQQQQQQHHQQQHQQQQHPKPETLPASSVYQPEHSPEVREYEQKMIQLLYQSHQTKKQVEHNHRNWNAQTSGLKGSDDVHK